VTKLFFALLAICLFTPVFAGDSGLYYDQSRDGEGISLHRDADRVVFYFFTYGAEDVEIADDGDVIFGEGNGQRWFFGSDEFDENSMESTGFLYITEGLEYPVGVPSDTDEGDVDEEDIVTVGEAEAVGIYSLERLDEGYRMVVEHFGDILEEDDFLFEHVFNFTSRLFTAND